MPTTLHDYIEEHDRIEKLKQTLEEYRKIKALLEIVRSSEKRPGAAKPSEKASAKRFRSW
jgi:hypothetical protein